MTDEPVPQNFAGDIGIAIDRFGAPAMDPTKNVLNVINSLDRYHTDMRKQMENYQTLMYSAEKLRIDDLATLRKEYDARIAEDLRVNVKTTSDQLAGQLVKETASLANQISTLTTSFSAQVTTLTTAVTGQINSLTAALTPRIADLERFRWESGGKTSVSDPAMTTSILEMTNAIALLKESRGHNDGVAETQKSNQASLISIGALILSLIVGGFTILSHASTPAISVTQPAAQGLVGPR